MLFNIMRRNPTIILFVILLLALACNKTNITPTSITSTVNHHIELETALNYLDSFLAEMNNATKSNGIERTYSIDNIDVVGNKILSNATKSTDKISNLPEEMLYLINFDDNLGSAVLAADDRIGDVVLCVTENGNLSITDFYDAYVAYDNTADIATKATPEDEEDVEISNLVGEQIVPAILLSSAIRSIENNFSDDNTEYKISTKALSTATKYGPYVQVKWSQDYVGLDTTNKVFNRYTPHNYYAGCVVIAVAQILLTNTNFTYNSYDGYNCYRNTMLTVANISDPSDPGSAVAQIQAGKFVYNLGDSSLLCNVSYGKKGTSGTANGAKRALKAFLYQDVTKYTGFGSKNQQRATNQLRAGRPVYLDGTAPGLFSSGHAWVLDGEWGAYYHVNWGWAGACDGYYSKGVFDTTQKAAEDSTTEAGVYWTSSKDHKYTWNYRMITYSI